MRVVTYTDEEGNQTISYIDYRGNTRALKQQISDTEWATTYYDYNALGNLVSITNAESQVTNMQYDDLGRLLMTDTPDAGITKNRYDQLDNVIFKQDANRATDQTFGWVYYTYNELGHLFEEGLNQTAPGSEPDYRAGDVRKTKYHYGGPLSTNAEGRLSFAIDEESQFADRYDYDSRGRVSQHETIFNANFQDYIDSRRIERTNSGSQSATINMDQTVSYILSKSVRIGRSRDSYARVHHKPSGGSWTVKAELRGNDRANRKTGSFPVSIGDQIKVSARRGETDFGINYSASCDYQEDVFSLSGESYITSYEYNSNNAIMEMTYPSPDVVWYSYNSLGQLESITDYIESAAEPGFTYDENGRVLHINYANSVQTSYTYNDRGWMNDVDFGTGGSGGLLTYDYFPNGNLKLVTNYKGFSDVYNYDALDRLKSVDYWDFNQPNRSYDYDKVGNRKTMNSTIYEYNTSNNHLLGLNGNTTLFSYDTNGNLEQDNDKGFTYNYDWKNRLVQVDGAPEGTVTYSYNHNDQRMKKTVGTDITYYIYAGNDMIAEYDGTGSLEFNYIYGNSQRLARVYPGGAKEYYHNDYLGSVRRITDNSGNVAWSRDYYPFGEDRTAMGITNDYKFTGNREETETDMYHFGYRDLMSSLGRWNAVDPSWLLRPNLSPYTYVGNNPLRWVDILGLDYWEEMNTGDWMYVFEEPVIARPWSWKDLLSLSFNSGVTSAKQTLSNKYPLATEDDSWFYQAWRGTGNIVTDVNNASMLMLGGGLGGVAVAAMSPAALALYTQYGPVLSAMGLTSAQQAHAWMTTVGYDKAGRFLSALTQYGKNVGYGGINYYSRNSYMINQVGQGYLSAKGAADIPESNVGRGVSLGVSIYDKYRR